MTYERTPVDYDLNLVDAPRVDDKLHQAKVVALVFAMLYGVVMGFGIGLLFASYWCPL